MMSSSSARGRSAPRWRSAAGDFDVTVPTLDPRAHGSRHARSRCRTGAPILERIDVGMRCRSSRARGRRSRASTSRRPAASQTQLAADEHGLPALGTSSAIGAAGGSTRHRAVARCDATWRNRHGCAAAPLTRRSSRTRPATRPSRASRQRRWHRGRDGVHRARAPRLRRSRSLQSFARRRTTERRSSASHPTV